MLIAEPRPVIRKFPCCRGSTAAVTRLEKKLFPWGDGTRKLLHENGDLPGRGRGIPSTARPWAGVSWSSLELGRASAGNKWMSEIHLAQNYWMLWDNVDMNVENKGNNGAYVLQLLYLNRGGKERIISCRGSVTWGWWWWWRSFFLQDVLVRETKR